MKKASFYFQKLAFYLVCAAFLAVYYFNAIQVKYPKALMLPKFIMIILGILILWNALDTFLKARKQWAAEHPDEEEGATVKEKGKFWKNNGKQIVVYVSAIVFIFVSQIVGFYVSTCVYIIALSTYLGIKKLYVTIPIAVIATAVLYLAFTVYLGVRLPTGFLI